MKYKIEINVDVPEKCGDIRDKLYGLLDADSGLIDDGTSDRQSMICSQ